VDVSSSTIVAIGIVLLAAGIIGKGLEIFGVKIPALDRGWQQYGLMSVGAIALLLGVLHPYDHQNNPRPCCPPPPTASSLTTEPVPSSSSTPSPLPSPSSTCARKLAITAPSSGATIADGSKGVQIDVTACGLQQGESGWLFDYDTGDGTYNFDGNGGPIVTQNGVATFSDVPIGNQGDSHKDTRITLVLASATCGRELMTLQSAPQPPTSLPPDCLITGQVDVYVTYP
jgi:hypothetical protein